MSVIQIPVTTTVYVRMTAMVISNAVALGLLRAKGVKLVRDQCFFFALFVYHSYLFKKKVLGTLVYGFVCFSDINVCKNVRCGRGECVITDEEPFYACKCIAPFQPPYCRRRECD